MQNQSFILITIKCLIFFSFALGTELNFLNIDNYIGQPPLKVCWLIKRFKSSQTFSKNMLLFYGPPGNGKTTLAHKISQVTESIFLDQTAPSIIESYIGSGAKKISSLFEYADSLTQENKKVVIFIDEIDAIASNIQTEFRSEHKLTLQQLWLELDKCKNNPNILTIFATNYFTKLDKTFLDRLGANTFEIKNPDASKRKEILNHYLEKAHISIDDETVKELIKNTEGLSIRSLEDMVNDIQMTSEIYNNNIITRTTIDDALKQTKSKFSHNISDQDKETKFERSYKWITLISSVLGIIINTHSVWCIGSNYLCKEKA